MSQILLVGLYKIVLRKHPKKTQAIQSALLFAAGNVITQHVTKEPGQDIDPQQVKSYAMMGALMGPVTYKWFGFLDDIIGKRKNFMTAIRKVFAEQLFMAPLLLAWALGASSFLDVEDFAEIFEELKYEPSRRRSFVDVYMVWPLVQFVTFVLPVNFRVPFQQTIFQGLYTYSSFKNKKESFDTKAKPL